MATVDSIASAAFTAVAAAITDAVHSATLNDGVTDYTGRVVFDGVKPPSGFPLSTPQGRVQAAYIEGLSAAPAVGWTMVANSVTYYVLGVRDIVQAGGLYAVNVISQAEMAWKSATFESISLSSDGAGGRTKSWSTLATQNAGLFAVRGNERWASMRTEEIGEWWLITPYISGLTASARVTIGGESYAIKFVDDVERRGVWHVLSLSKGAAT